MASAPQVQNIVVSLAYTSAQYDDPNDTYDSVGSYDGAAPVQLAPSDQVLVDVQ